MEDLLLVLSVLSVLSLILLFKAKQRSATHPHGLKPYPFVGHLPHFIKNRRRFLDWLSDALATTPTQTLVFHRIGGVRGIVTANPSNVEHILRSSFDNYPKGPRLRSLLLDFLGTGIFNADGPLWRAQRKPASHEFNTRSLRSFVVHVVQQESASRLLPLLHSSAAAATVLDLQAVLERFGFNNVCRVGFGVDPELLPGFTQAFEDATNLSAERFLYAIPGLWKLKRLLNIGKEGRLKECIATVDAFSLQIIRARRKEALSSGSDLLSRFLAGEDGGSDEFLRDIIVSFLLAGRETTALALSWFFWLLSSNPDVEGKILYEIRSLRERRPADGSGEFEFDELREMHYLHAALTESMRLYPPLPVNTTQCVADEVMPDGTEVKRGWFASYSSYAMGRMEGVWGEDCREYKPERWLDAAGVFRPENPFKYPVFHAGPRMCLGKEMAYIQMKSVAASVLERFAVEVVGGGGERPEMVVLLTLRMKDGLRVMVREREGGCGANVESHIGSN